MRPAKNLATGGLESLTRDEAKEIVRAGGRMASSVSRKTDYVVGKDSGSKHDDATRLAPSSPSTKPPSRNC